MESLESLGSGDVGHLWLRSSYISDYNPQPRDECYNSTEGYRNQPDFLDPENDNFFQIQSTGDRQTHIA